MAAESIESDYEHHDKDEKTSGGILRNSSDAQPESGEQSCNNSAEPPQRDRTPARRDNAPANISETSSDEENRQIVVAEDALKHLISLYFRENAFEIEATWAGPLPSPGDFREYEAIPPGTAERLLSLYESKITAGVRTDEKITDGAVAASRNRDVRAARGQWIAAGLAVLSFGVAAYFASKDLPWSAALFVSMPMALLIASFLPKHNR